MNAQPQEAADINYLVRRVVLCKYIVVLKLMQVFQIETHITKENT